MQQYVAVARQKELHVYAEARPSGTFKADTCLLEKGKWRTARQQVSCTEVYGSSQVKHNYEIAEALTFNDIGIILQCAQLEYVQEVMYTLYMTLHMYKQHACHS